MIILTSIGVVIWRKVLPIAFVAGQPHNRAADLEEPRLEGYWVRPSPEVQPLEAFVEAGLLARTMDEEGGGIQLPHTVMRACFG